MSSPTTDLVGGVTALINDSFNEADETFYFVENLKHEIEGRIIDDPDNLTLQWVLERLRRQKM